MSEIERVLSEAHKIAAGATGRLAVALARKKLQKDTIESVATDLKRALVLVESMGKPKAPWKR